MTGQQQGLSAPVTVEDVALLASCPACGAEPGYWCVTYRPTRRPAGNLTTWLHQPRLDGPEQLRQTAYRDGIRQATSSLVYELSAARTGAWWTERDGVPKLPDSSVEDYITRWAQRW